MSLLIKLQQLWEREGGKFLENVNDGIRMVAFRSINALKQCLEGIGGVFIAEEEWDDR